MKLPNTKRMTCRFPILLAGLVLLGLPALAQMPRPTLSVEGDLLGKVRLDDPPVTALAERSSKIGAAHFSAALTYPVIIDQGKTVFFFEGAYRQRRFTFSDWPENVSKDIDRLHEVSAGLTVRRAFNQQWAVILNLTPQLLSNFEGDKLEEEDFEFRGGIIAEKTFNDRWTAGLGVAYSTAFGQPIPLPIATFRYESGGRWHASGTLPENVNLWYRLSSRSELGLVAHADGGLYHIAEVYPEGSTIEDPEIQYISALIGPALQTQFEGMKFTVRGGLAYESFNLFDGTDEIDNSKFDLKLGAFANAGIEISF